MHGHANPLPVLATLILSVGRRGRKGKAAKIFFTRLYHTTLKILKLKVVLLYLPK
jgi:hypothetical protein